MGENEFLNCLSKKRLSPIRIDVSWGDLALQEATIVDRLSTSKTLSDANQLIDELLMFVSLCKGINNRK